MKSSESLRSHEAHRRSPSHLIREIWKLAREVAWLSGGDNVLFNFREKLDSLDVEAQKKTNDACQEAKVSGVVRERLLVKAGPQVDDAQAFRTYSDTPTGEELKLTREEFDQVVEVFTILLKWKQELDSKDK